MVKHMPKGWTLEEATSRQFTDEERELLASWNRHDLLDANEQVFGDAEITGWDKIDDGNTGDTDHFHADTGSASASIVRQGHNPLNPGQAQRAAQMAADESDLDVDVDAQRDAEQDLASGLAPTEDEVDEEADDQYGKMKNSELRDLLDQRGLPRSGNRQEILARLRTHDAEA